MSSLHYTETERTTGDVEAKHLFFLSVFQVDEETSWSKWCN